MDRTRRPGAKVSRKADLERRNASVYATLRADNIATNHLLELVRALAPPDSYLSDSLVDVGSHLEYQLRLDPSSSRVLWKIGSGSANRTPGVKSPDDVDFLLCPPGDGSSLRHARRAIDALHGHFQFHLESGVLLFVSLSDRPTLCEHGLRPGLSVKMQRAGATDNRLAATAPVRVMCKTRNRLSMGDYQFVLVYNRTSSCNREERMYQMRRGILKSAGGRPMRAFQLFPPVDYAVMGHILVYECRRLSALSALYIGVDVSSGQPVRVFEFRFKHQIREQCRQRLSALSEFKGDISEGVIGIIDSWCEHNLSPPCGLQQMRHDERFEEIIFYTMAMPSATWKEMDWRNMSFTEKLSYFEQSLRGLCIIHDRNLVHGRIHPSSLSLVICRRIRAGDGSLVPDVDRRLLDAVEMKVVIDEAQHATQNPDQKDKITVNKLWSAPEVAAFSTAPPWRPEPPYGPKADIYSLAMCWLGAFGLDLPTKSYSGFDEWMAPEDVCYWLQKVKTMVPSSFYQLLGAMLAPDPATRPTAAMALGQLTWPEAEKQHAHLEALEERVRALEDTERMQPGSAMSQGDRRVALPGTSSNKRSRIEALEERVNELERSKRARVGPSEGRNKTSAAYRQARAMDEDDLGRDDVDNDDDDDTTEDEDDHQSDLEHEEDEREGGDTREGAQDSANQERPQDESDGTSEEEEDDDDDLDTSAAPTGVAMSDPSTRGGDVESMQGAGDESEDAETPDEIWHTRLGANQHPRTGHHEGEVVDSAWEGTPAVAEQDFARQEKTPAAPEQESALDQDELGRKMRPAHEEDDAQASSPQATQRPRESTQESWHGAQKQWHYDLGLDSPKPLDDDMQQPSLDRQRLLLDTQDRPADAEEEPWEETQEDPLMRSVQAAVPPP